MRRHPADDSAFPFSPGGTKLPFIRHCGSKDARFCHKVKP